MSDDGLSPTEFGRAARLVADECRNLELVVPSFRAPPKQPDEDRTLRWVQNRPIIAIRIRHRAIPEVLADLIAGVLVANRMKIGTPEGDGVDHALRVALSGTRGA